MAYGYYYSYKLIQQFICTRFQQILSSRFTIALAQSSDSEGPSRSRSALLQAHDALGEGADDGHVVRERGAHHLRRDPVPYP